jgi:hypothetical protein
MIERDLRCLQKDSFNFTFTIRESENGEPGAPMDITGFEAYSEIRDSLTDGELVATMVFNSTEEDLENGVVSMFIDASVTEDIPVGTYYYDIVLVNGANVNTYFRGKFVVLSRVTSNV